MAGAVGRSVGVVNNPDLFLVVDRSQLEAVLVVRCEVELEQAIGLLGGRGGTLIFLEIVAGVVGGFNQAKDEEFVLDDGAATIDVGAESGPGVGCIEHPVTFASGFRLFVQDVLSLGTQGGRFPVHGNAALPFIGTALGGQTDHAAQRAAILGTVTAGLDLLLRNRVERQVGVGQEIADVGDVVTIDVVAVFSHRCTAEGGDSTITQTGVALDDARSQQGDCVDIARHRQTLQLLLREQGVRLNTGNVNGRARAAAGHLNLLQRRTAEHDLCARANRYGDFLLFATGGNAIATGLQFGQAELAAGIGLYLTRGSGFQAGHSHSAAGLGLAVKSTLGALGHRDRRQHQANGDGQRRAAPCLRLSIGVFENTSSKSHVELLQSIGKQSK